MPDPPDHALRRLQRRVNLLAALVLVLCLGHGLQLYREFFAGVATVRSLGLSIADAAATERIALGAQQSGPITVGLKTPEGQGYLMLTAFGAESSSLELQFGDVVADSFGSSRWSRVTLQSDAPSLTLTAKDGRSVVLSPDGLTDGDGNLLAAPPAE